MHLASNLQSLRTAIPYIRAYKGSTFVIKLGGELCRPGPALRNLAEQIALLHHQLRHLQQKLNDRLATSGERHPREELPPHY